MIRRLVPLLLVALCGCTTPGGPRALMDTSGLAGASDAQIRAAFGEPVFVRKDGGAQIWRYDGQGCKAFFFLYANGSALSVTHVETLPHGGASSADQGCLAALQSAQHPQPAKTS